jgi:hypothetical protein
MEIISNISSIQWKTFMWVLCLALAETAWMDV